MSRNSWSRNRLSGAPAPSSNGFTLIELTVWCFLAMLFLTAVYAIFVSGHRMYESASGSYMIGQEIEAGMRYLREDLQETALSSVRVYPNGVDASKTPGLSLVSAHGFDDRGRFHVSRYGAPDWGKHVYYVLEPAGDMTANLVRWEKEDAPKSVLPLPSLIPADDGGKDSSKNRRIVIRNVLRPGVTVKDVGEGGKYTADADYGGFKVSFVRQDATTEELTPWNPTQVSAEEDGNVVKLRQGATRVVEVQLSGVLSTLGSGKPSLYSVRFRVSPRH